MKKAMILCLSLILVLSMAGCRMSEDESLYAKSRKANGAGEIANVVDVFLSDASIHVANGTSVSFKIGIGGDCNRNAHQGESMSLKIEAAGCRINGSEVFFEKEYPDYYSDDAYFADVEEHYFGYPDKTPNYYETIEITFPTSKCSGRIHIQLVNQDDHACETAELTVYYASNGSVLWIADEVISGVDDNNRPIYVN